ncbi:DUF1772-domain-containing protein [Xylaria sp. FL1777]|nr:DUF1772-domain-containing protein [Xylaria sp. FL1777]
MSLTTIRATAVITGSLLSGAMMSLSVVAVPVMVDTADHAPLLFRQWARMYYYGHQIMPSMGIATLVLYINAAMKGYSMKKPWGMLAMAGVTTVCMVPFTWIVMAPGNDNLFRLEAASKTKSTTVDFNEAKGLLVTWAWLHFVRTLFPLAGTIMGTVEMLRA